MILEYCTVLHFNTCGVQVSKWNCGWWLESSSYPTTKIDLSKLFVRFVSVAWKTRAWTQHDSPWGNSIFFWSCQWEGRGGYSTLTSLNKWPYPYHWVHFSHGLRANLYGPIAGHHHHAFVLHERFNLQAWWKVQSSTYIHTYIQPVWRSSLPSLTAFTCPL